MIARAEDRLRCVNMAAVAYILASDNINKCRCYYPSIYKYYKQKRTVQRVFGNCGNVSSIDPCVCVQMPLKKGEKMDLSFL